MPTPVPVSLKARISIHLAFIWLGIPALLLWLLFHLAAIGLICNCVPGGLFPEWAPESSAFGGTFSLVGLVFADWFVWTRWRSYRREKKWREEYQRANPAFHKSPEFLKKKRDVS